MKKFEFVDFETGEILERKDIVKDFYVDENIKYEVLVNKFYNDKDSLTLEEIEFLRKKTRKGRNVKLDYSNGFIITDVDFPAHELNSHTCKFILLLYSHLSYDGFLIYKNNRRIKTFNDLKKIFNYSGSVWVKISKDIKKYNIITKITTDNGDYLVINPFFSKGRVVSGISFIAFYKEFKKYLDELDYIYLIKRFEINPE
jgi:hypothetical protein